MTQFYTYIYYDSSTPIYVGKGKEQRAYVHLNRKGKHPLTHKLAKMKREGKEPQIQIIDAPNEAEAFKMEELLISMIGRRDLGTGTLLNLTDGGEGAAGAICSTETRAKMAVAKKGKPLSAEHKAKMSAAKKGKPLSLEHRAKVAAGHGKPCTVDGINIYPSKNALIDALGKVKMGYAIQISAMSNMTAASFLTEQICITQNHTM